MELDRLLADVGVSVPIRHAVSTVIEGPASEIQEVALPDAVAGRDLLAVAPTGSGKTLVFAVAVAHLLAGAPSVPGHPRALVIAPTRELALQNAEVLADVGAGSGLRVAGFVGGQPVARDKRTLVAPVDVAVGTPGRVAELVRSGAMSTDAVRVVVLDEADQLLGSSFGDQVTAILDSCRDAAVQSTTATTTTSAPPVTGGDTGKGRSTTTTPPPPQPPPSPTDVEEILRARKPELRVHRVRTPVEPAVSGADSPGGAPRTLVVVSTADPEGFAVSLASRCRRALFFVARRAAVEPLRASIAATGVTASGVVGSASPTRRAAAFAELGTGTVRVLVSTDLAGRGLDLDAVSHVVHVGMPHSVQDLVHRSGRTGRGTSAAGVVAAIVRPSDVARISAQARDSGMSVELLESADGVPPERAEALFGPEIAAPRSRRAPAPAARTRRPATSRPHRPKKKRRT